MSGRATLSLLAGVLTLGCAERPLDAARARAEGGDLRGAAVAARAVAAADPANMPAWDLAVELFCRRLADVGECLGTLDVELDRLGKLDRHGEVLADALERRARARVEQGLVAAALEDLDRADKVAPGRASLWTARSLAFRRQGDDARALAALEEARRLDPRNAEAEALARPRSSPADEGFGGGPP